MKASRTFAAVLALAAMAGALSVPAGAAIGPQGKKQEAKPQTKASSMPKEVAAIIQEGLATRQGRQDIPFSLFKHLVLPAQGQNLYPVFFFKARNGDLGYAPSAAGTGEMEAPVVVFFQFLHDTPAGTLAPMISGRASGVLKTDGAGYSPENEDWYSLGLALPAGTYTLALVLASPDMKKMSVAYTDVTLPAPEAYAASLWPTAPVIVAAMEQVEQDQRPTLHRGYFTWGALKVAPNFRGDIAVGENLEVFFFVLGAADKVSAGRTVNDFEVEYEIQDPEGKPAIKWAAQAYETYFINQPLPLIQTLQTMNEKGEVLSTEKKPLEAGKYVLAIKVTDKLSGKKAEAKMDFSVR
ncbi:MAG TPA: hypothetical protein PLP83_04880 [Candidatus Aminicenantes bacterium]|nr:hypothetical protein [Candidatus Aminicenantes bacterium]